MSEPQTDDPSDIVWQNETEGGIGILGVDGMYAARRAQAWQRLIDGSATDADRKLLAQLWTE
jgi:hypothetical protein